MSFRPDPLFRRRALVLLGAMIATTGAARAVDPAQGEYRLQPGDVISITLQDNPPVTTPTGGLTIPPDGKVSFAWVKGVQAAGRTRSELEKALVDGIRHYILDPSISVNLVLSPFNVVTVNGALDKPGQFPYRPGLTVAEAIALAGGPKDFANKTAIVIRRGSASSTLLRVDLSALFSGSSEANLALQPGDIVMVSDAFVSVDGRVRTPGNYAFRLADTASKAIAAAGGLLADPNLQQAYVRRGDRTIVYDLRDTTTGDTNSSAPLNLQPGDYLFIPPLKSHITALGAVATPGPVYLIPKERDKVLDVLSRAGGPTLNADNAHILLRRNINSSQPIDMILNLGPKGKPADNVIMENGDVLFVPERQVKNRTEALVSATVVAQLLAILKRL